MRNITRPLDEKSHRAFIAHRRIYCAAFLLWAALSRAPAQDIPCGFTFDRYVRLWERNPFTLVESAAPKSLPSVFEKLFLASWLKEGGKDVILVQNSQTSEVQSITTVPNQNNLRLVEVHIDPNPRYVAFVISDGRELGTVKFRFDEQPNASASVPVPITSNGATAQAPAYRLHSEVRRVPGESGPKPSPPRRKHYLTETEPEESGQN